MALQLRQVDQIIRVQEAPLSERLLQLLLEPSRFRGGFDLEVAQEAGEAAISWQRALSKGQLLRDLRRATSMAASRAVRCQKSSQRSTLWPRM